jgi:hypothetical protein
VFFRGEPYSGLGAGQNAFLRRGFCLSGRRFSAAVPLELLVASPRDITEGMMRAHGFTIDDMVALAHAGLATATAERVVAGSKTMEVARVRITEAGRSGAGSNEVGGDGQAS